MPLSCDWPTKVITILQSELTLVGGTYYTLDVTYYFQLLRELNSSAEGIAETIGFPLYLNTSPTTGTPRIVDIINGYTIQFEDGLYSVDFIDGNVNWRTVEIRNQVSIGTNNTAALIDPTFLEIPTFVGKQGLCVSVKSTGTDSVEYPVGNRQSPCKTEMNFHMISETRGFHNIYILDSINITGDHSVGHVFFGDNPQSVNINCDIGSDVTNCKFQDCYLTGKLDAFNIVWECIVGDLTNVNGFIYKSALAGTLTILDNTNFEDCFIANTAPNQEITIDFDNLAKTVIIADWSAGRIRPINMVAGSFIGVSGTGGIVITDASNIGGTIAYAGSIGIDDTYSDNVDLLKDNTVSGQTIKHLEQAIWIDTESLIAGDGSQRFPFNVLTTAIDYAEKYNIKTLYVYADIVLDRQLKNFKIIGVGTPTIDCNGQNLSKSEFWHCQMEGDYIGAIIVQESYLKSGFWLNGSFEKNGLGGDLFCVDGGTVYMTQNASAIAGLGRPTISMNAAGSCKLSVRKNGGGLTIKHCNDILDEVTAEISEGSLTFDNTNNLLFDGQMIARGLGKFVNETTGFNVVNEMQSKINIDEKIEGNYSLAHVLRVIAAVASGEVAGLDTLNPIFMAMDKSKPRVAAITDNNGNRTSVTVDAA